MISIRKERQDVKGNADLVGGLSTEDMSILVYHCECLDGAWVKDFNHCELQLIGQRVPSSLTHFWGQGGVGSASVHAGYLTASIRTFEVESPFLVYLHDRDTWRTQISSLRFRYIISMSLKKFSQFLMMRGIGQASYYGAYVNPPARGFLKQPTA
jgi:hypothetical protein